MEYKRSAAPMNAAGNPGFWENDAIQVCRGVPGGGEPKRRVESGILYYIGSKARVEVPFDDTLRAKTRAAIELIHELAAGLAPEPLPDELRHRCFGCSLAPICLPEETLYLIHRPETTTDPKPNVEPTPTIASSHSNARRRGERRQGRALLARARLPRREAEQPPGRHAQVPGDQSRADRLDRQVVVYGNVQISTRRSDLAEARSRSHS